MANIAASDVTHTVLKQRRGLDSRTCNKVSLAFGNGALTYEAGGVPISKALLGCPNVIESLIIYDKGTSGYTFTYDATNEKIVMIQGDNDGVADGPGNQPSTVAIAAQTILAEVIGW